MTEKGVERTDGLVDGQGKYRISIPSPVLIIKQRKLRSSTCVLVSKILMEKHIALKNKNFPETNKLHQKCQYFSLYQRKNILISLYLVLLWYCHTTTILSVNRKEYVLLVLNIISIKVHKIMKVDSEIVVKYLLPHCFSYFSFLKM